MLKYWSKKCILKFNTGIWVSKGGAEADPFGAVSVPAPQRCLKAIHVAIILGRLRWREWRAGLWEELQVPLQPALWRSGTKYYIIHPDCGIRICISCGSSQGSFCQLGSSDSTWTQKYQPQTLVISWVLKKSCVRVLDPDPGFITNHGSGSVTNHGFKSWTHSSFWTVYMGMSQIFCHWIRIHQNEKSDPDYFKSMVNV